MGRKRKVSEKQKTLLRFYQRGKASHIVMNGVFSWGILTGLLFLTIQSLWNNGLSFNAWRTEIFSSAGFVTMIIFMAGGSLWGLWTWKQIEKNVADIDRNRRKGKPRNQAN